MARKRTPRALTKPWYDVDNPWREADFLREFSHPQNAEAGIFSWLQHDSVADGERRPQRSAEHLCGIVPRQNMTGNANRLADQRDEITGFVGNSLAMQLVRRATVIFEIASSRADILASLRQWLAGVPRLDHCQFGF